VPYIAYAAAAAAWIALVVPNLGTLDPISYVDNPLAHMSALERIPRAAALLWHYLGLVMLPISLKPDRSFATTMPTTLEGLVGTIAWIVLLAICWLARKRDPLAVFLTLWFPAAFAVTANVVYAVGTIMAERLAFTPSVGILLLAGLLAERLVAGARWRRIALGFTAALAALLLAFAYDARGRVWASDSHYHFVAAVESPASAKAHYNLGLERAGAEDYPAAEAAFRRALQIYPAFDMAAYYLSGILVQDDRTPEAIDVYKSYLAQVPDDQGALSQLVTLELGADRFADARATAERLVALDPKNSAHLGMQQMVEMFASGGRIERAEIPAAPAPSAPDAKPAAPAPDAEPASVLEGKLQDGKTKAPH
jgi:tetratricopeptide (TPR) repeat protein